MQPGQNLWHPASLCTWLLTYLWQHINAQHFGHWVLPGLPALSHRGQWKSFQSSVFQPCLVMRIIQGYCHKHGFPGPFPRCSFLIGLYGVQESDYLTRAQVMLFTREFREILSSAHSSKCSLSILVGGSCPVGIQALSSLGIMTVSVLCTLGIL